MYRRPSTRFIPILTRERSIKRKDDSPSAIGIDWYTSLMRKITLHNGVRWVVVVSLWGAVWAGSFDQI